MKHTFGVRPILILLVLISMVPVFVAIVQTSISEQDRAIEKATTSLRIQTQLRANSQEEMLEGVRHMLMVIAHAPAIRNPEPEACSEYLRDLNEHFPQYANFGFADPFGNTVCRSARDRRTIYLGDRQYFKAAVRTGGFTAGEYLVSRTSGKPAIAISLPVFRPGGELHGVLYVLLELTGMQKEFDAVSVPPDMTDAIADAGGVVLASAGNRTQRVGERLTDAFLLKAVQTRHAVIEKAEDDLGQMWFYAVQFVDTPGSGGLAVSSMISRDSVLDPVVKRLQLELAMLLVLALLASLLAWRIGDRLLARPIERLLAKVRALERGEDIAGQPSDMDHGRVHELRSIHRGINDLAQALAARSKQRDIAIAEIQEKKKALERSEQRYRSQFEASPQPMWIIDAESLAFLVVNDAAVAHYGYSREEFARMTLANLYSSQDLLQVAENIKECGSEPQYGMARKHRCKSGEVINVEIASHSLDWDGRAARMTIAYDITSSVLAKQAWERLHETLEQEVAQRTRELKLANEELELANQELEAFSYSVSHDLRGPLHTIDGFCSALVDKHSNALPAQANHYLSRIRAGTLQMHKLIADFLSFARTGRAPVVLRQADLAPLAARVVAHLRLRDPERQVSVDIERRMPALCDPSLLTIVFENLIANAWKFTSRTPQATIGIACAAATETETTYVVSDTGAGFDPAHAEKLFRPFMRLHSVSEFEGTGIGLAIVYRIVHRHGGRVWAESQPGNGARFYFSLPKEPGKQFN